MDDRSLEPERVLTGLVNQGYSDIAVEHAINPRNLGRMEDASGYACYTGPCGDTMEIWVKAVDGKVERASFFTDGCGSTIACGSMVTEIVTGMGLEEAAAVSQEDVLDGLGGLPDESRHCALLAATTLKMAVEDCMERK